MMIATAQPVPAGDFAISHRGKVSGWSFLLAFWTSIFAVIWFVAGGVQTLLAYGFTIAVWIFLMDYAGVEVDAIYERGVASSDAWLTDTLTKRGFQPFDEIAVIAETRDSRGVEGLVLFVGPHRRIRICPIWKRYSTPSYDAFFERLRAVLREKCPSAKWVHLPLDRPSLKRRRMTWREARRPIRTLVAAGSASEP